MKDGKKGKNLPIYKRDESQRNQYQIKQGLGEIAIKQTLVKATNYRKMWRSMIIHVLMKHDT